MNAVELKNVTFSYDGAADVLQGADFQARYGEIALVAGHSGEGKSTLLSVVGGIIPNIVCGRLRGGVLVGGEDMRGKKLGQICRKVGVVLQNADEQIVHKLVEDEIAFGCENLAFPPAKIAAQIDIVCRMMQLDPAWKTRTLSGGQKQRLITASTLAMGQKILILDEPLANLDSRCAAQLMSALRALADAGYCVIVAEHRLDMVLSQADRVWHIGGGRIAEVGNIEAYRAEQTRGIADTCAPFQSAEPLLRLDGVGFSVKKKTILQRIDCAIPQGGRTVLLGENGCGKTTLLRLIARLYKPTYGRITQYIDAKLKQRTRASRLWFKNVGLVYQNPDYQLFMPTVRAEIAFGARPAAYAERILAMFDLEQLAERHPQSLSEGQKRRVSIAAVAACRPRLLLLDEPTVGLDYEGLRGLVRILNDLHAETGNTMITVTHDVRCAEALCDTSLLIADGVIKERGGKELVRRYFAANSADGNDRRSTE